MRPLSKMQGFTLIELSIVLVVIGLLVGGVLAGRDMIKASEVRATITQIEKYNQAVNTFRGKYGALPGDLNAATATQFGFAPRGSYAGEGDGNGIIEGVDSNAAGQNSGIYEDMGETIMFWQDLTAANGLNVNLIDGSFTTASPTATLAYCIGAGCTSISSALPAAKLGNGNYIYVWSQNSVNYFGLSAVTSINNAGYMSSQANLTVMQAYSIDSKIDDGFPQTGNVTAQHLAGGVQWAPYPPGGLRPYQTGSGSSSTCYDDNGSSSNPMQYSLEISSGTNPNCALSFRFQ